jgi:hypothetical protein
MFLNIISELLYTVVIVRKIIKKGNVFHIYDVNTSFVSIMKPFLEFGFLY